MPNELHTPQHLSGLTRVTWPRSLIRKHHTDGTFLHGVSRLGRKAWFCSRRVRYGTTGDAQRVTKDGVRAVGQARGAVHTLIFQISGGSNPPPSTCNNGEMPEWLMGPDEIRLNCLLHRPRLRRSVSSDRGFESRSLHSRFRVPTGLAPGGGS